MLENTANAYKLLTDVVCIFLLSFSYIGIKKNRNYSFPVINAFIIVNIIANCFELLTTIYHVHSAGFSEPVLVILQNGYNCSALIAVGCWFVNSLQVTRSRLIGNKWLMCLVLLPLTILVALTFTTGFHHLIFSFDESFRYVRGPWFLYFVIAAGLYLCASFCLYVYADLNKEIFVFKGLNRISSAYSAILAVFLGIQLATKGTISVINTAGAIVALMIHEDLQQKAITVDTLTKLNNRNAINSFLLKILKQDSYNGFAVLLDLDYFKQINDRYGHLEGDRALVLVGEAMRRVITDKSFFGRMAGDEFLIITEQSEADVGSLEDRLNAGILEILEENDVPFRFAVSTGIVRITPAMKTIPDVLEAVDKKLYLRKKEKHAERR